MPGLIVSNGFLIFSRKFTLHLENQQLMLSSISGADGAPSVRPPSSTFDAAFIPWSTALLFSARYSFPRARDLIILPEA
jgi:hypothetical protein